MLCLELLFLDYCSALLWFDSNPCAAAAAPFQDSAGFIIIVCMIINSNIVITITITMMTMMMMMIIMISITTANIIIILFLLRRPRRATPTCASPPRPGSRPRRGAPGSPEGIVL